MAFKNMFNIKDKVFAKIEDHPAWPAMITGVKNENSLQPKFMVHFYGTYAFAECVQEELFSYEKNKLKFVKQKKLSPFKRAQFVKAFKEIENDFVIPIYKKYVSTTRNGITKKSNSRSNNKLNKLCASTSEELDSPKNSIQISKKSSVAKQVICKKQMNFKKKYSLNVKRILKKQPVVVLVRMPLPSETKKHQDSKSSIVGGTNGQNCCTNENNLLSSITTEHIQVAKSRVYVEESNQTAKSMFENEKKNSKKPQQGTNQKNDVTMTEQSRPSLKSNKNMQNPKSIVSIEHNFNNNEIKNCVNQNEHSNLKINDKNVLIKGNTKDLKINRAEHSKTTEFSLPINNMKTKGTIQENDVQKTKRSRFSLRLNKKRQNYKNLVSTKHTSNISESGKNCINQNEYSDKDENILTEENIKDSELHSAGSSKSSMCSLPKEDVKIKAKISSVRNVSKKNLSTLSSQTEIHYTCGQTQKLPNSSQDCVVDAGPKVRMKKAQTKEDIRFKINKLQELCNVMDCIHEIRSALSVDNPNYKVTIASLLQIKKYNLSTFMWKKHPDIVQTIMKVSRYTGDIQNVPDRKLKEHIKNSTRIRSIAQDILVKIASLFNVSMQTFETAYWLASNEFYDKFKDLDLNTLHSATSEDQLNSLL